VGSLTPQEKDAYCRESSGIEPLLGIPTRYLPRTVSELQGYLEQMLANKQIEVNETARVLAKEVLNPGGAWPLKPPMLLVRLFTIGTLPPSIRAAYGLSWNSRQKIVLGISSALIRGLIQILPPVFRYWKMARVAEKRWRKQ
jgi:uncharacterized protein (DUF2236 family)